jgi:multiple sugar transport system substrate-binding protein
MKRIVMLMLFAVLAGALLFAGGKQEEAPAAEQLPYEGKVLRLASVAEQFSPYLVELGKQFEKVTGARIEVDTVGYPELYQRITQDYASGTALYDLATVDIVWSGQFSENGWTVDLKPWIERDKKEINTSDILPVMWFMGSWKDTQVAYPMAGYANSLIYRKDLFESAEEKAAFKAEYGYELGLPQDMKQFGDVAEFFTRPDENFYGLVANGARGPAVAQDWMEYMRAFGGAIFDDAGNVTINSKECLNALNFFVDIFDNYAPPGAIGYWWDDRETAYRTGQVAMQSSWSIARAGYEDPSISMVVDKTAMGAVPTVSDDTLYGVGGWGIGINAGVSEENQEIAWEFIKWITSPEKMKDWMRNDGAPIRRSTLTDSELVAEKPWLPTMLDIFENGDGDYRPRIPQYAMVQDILALRINQAITHELSAEEALKLAEKDIKAIF